MKATAIILLLICLASFVGLGYLYMSSSVIVEDVELTICEADTQVDLYNELRSQATSGCAAAIVFSADIPEKPENCVFLMYSVKLRNKTHMNAEQAEVRITPLQGDYVQQSETSIPIDLAPGTTGNVNVVLLSDRDTGKAREFTVSYYLWGIPFFTRTTYSR